MKDPLFFTAVRGLNLVGIMLLQAIMLLGVLGSMADLVCADHHSAARLGFGLSVWIACSNTTLFMLVRMVWTYRRADVLHQRGAEVIDKRKER